MSEIHLGTTPVFTKSPKTISHNSNSGTMVVHKTIKHCVMKTWKPIKRFNGDYEVSDCGDVRSTHRVIKKRDGTVYTRISKELSPANRKGYLVYGISYNWKMSSHLAHRLVAEEFLPNPDNKKEVNHKDGNKANNNVLNLEWVTRRENLDHAIKNGLVARNSGEKNGNSKLTQEIVDNIRATYKPHTFGLLKTARMFNTSKRNVLDIIKNKIWKPYT